MNLIGWILECLLIIFCVILFRKGLKVSDTKKASNFKSASVITLIALSACIFMLFPKGDDIPESAYDHDEEAAARLEMKEEGLNAPLDEEDEDDEGDVIDDQEMKKDEDAFDIERTIDKFVDENFSFDVALEELTLNENMGTNKEDDYIALVNMDMPKAISIKKGYEWIDKYSNYLAVELAEKHEDVSELVIFWKMAGSKKNVAKYVLKREGKNFVFESKWQDPNVTD